MIRKCFTRRPDFKARHQRTGSEPISSDATLLSRLLNGAPSTISFGLGATLLGVGAGSIIGVIAGTAGGWIDSVVMRVLDGLLAVPELLFTLVIVTVLGGGMGQAMLAVALAFTPGMARIARSSVLSIRTREYVLAAVARGEGAAYIVTREVLPNALGPIIVESTIRVAFAIMIGAHARISWTWRTAAVDRMGSDGRRGAAIHVSQRMVRRRARRRHRARGHGVQPVR